MLLQSLYFSRFLPNRPRPLSSFDTHLRWQPVTQSARSRRSYGKIEDCEQFTIIVIIVICFPTEHLGVLRNSLKRICASQIELEVLVFKERGKPEYRKTSQSKGENQQHTQPTYGVDAGIRSRATLVGGSALTTAPPLLSQLNLNKIT